MTLSVDFFAARAGRAKRFFVLLHGYGANGDDLRPLVPFFASFCPADTAFWVPDAPEPCPWLEEGRQWFPLDDIKPEGLQAGLEIAWPLFEKKLARYLEKAGLSHREVILAGFSQGAMMAFYGACQWQWQHQATIGFSGFLPFSEKISLANSIPPSPVLVIHGTADQTIPLVLARQTVSDFKRAGLEVDYLELSGFGHGINDSCLERAQSFLEGLGKKKAENAPDQ